MSKTAGDGDKSRRVVQSSTGWGEGGGGKGFLFSTEIRLLVKHTHMCRRGEINGGVGEGLYIILSLICAYRVSTS